MEYYYDIEAVDHGITLTDFAFNDDYLAIAMARQEISIELGLDPRAIGKIKIYRTKAYDLGETYKEWDEPILVHES